MVSRGETAAPSARASKAARALGCEPMKTLLPGLSTRAKARSKAALAARASKSSTTKLEAIAARTLGLRAPHRGWQARAAAS
eukprot:5639355-Alexandrium_andersonii.AAC.1